MIVTQLPKSHSYVKTSSCPGSFPLHPISDLFSKISVSFTHVLLGISIIALIGSCTSKVFEKLIVPVTHTGSMSIEIRYFSFQFGKFE